MTVFKPRTVRSFVCRKGRMTPGQTRAWETHREAYGIKPQPFALPSDYFLNSAPVIVEIGFGMGQTLAQMAQQEPQVNFIGIEVHQPGIGSLLARIAEERLDNLRLWHGDAVMFLQQYIHDNSLLGVQIYFPDPWPKKRHQKRRLVQASFANLLQQKLQSGGFVHLATDWQPYAEQMMQLFSTQPGWYNQIAPNEFANQQTRRPPTKFGQRGLALGHPNWDLIFVKQ